MFQFQYGTIKRAIHFVKLLFGVAFQFQYGTIKSNAVASV